VRLTRTEVLANERCRSICQTDGWQQSKDHHADTDLIPRDRLNTKSRYNSHKPYPACRLNKKLQNSRGRHFDQPPQTFPIDVPVVRVNANPLLAKKEFVRCEEDAESAAKDRSYCCTSNS